MVDGLADDRWALVFKVHHCMVDGVSGADLMTILLDASAEPPPPAPDDDWVPAHEPSDAVLVARASLGPSSSPSSCVRDRCARSQHPPSGVCDPRRRRDGLPSFGRGRRAEPSGSSIGPIGPHRRWAGRACRPRRHQGDHAGLRRHGQRRRARRHRRRVPRPAASTSGGPDHAVLRSLVPVSVRPAGDGHPTTRCRR